MARGKQTCRILKEIRRRIAEANDIEYVTSECQYKGDCAGTCPRCEAEVRYLEEQLASRRLAGKAVFLAGLTALSACTGANTAVPIPEAAVEAMPDTACCLTEELEGDVAFNEPDTVEAVETASPDIVSELLVVGEVELPDEAVSEALVISEQTSDLNKIVVGEIDGDNEPDSDGNYNIAMVPVKPDVDSIDRFIRENLLYPQAAIADRAEGRVVVEIVVDSTGTIADKRLVRPRHPALDKEVLRLVSSIDYVRPARLDDGRNVNCVFTVVVAFRLPEENSAAEQDSL
ncbi:MAG: energy transducer TonB [Muribaculaceae bacterium]|nr:energy transducer TonB [Muribaculaceae bacterium]